MKKILLAPGEAAVLLGIGKTKLYELLAAGEIESVLIGRCRRIPRPALDDYVVRLRRGDAA
jgi:excisionase family DNA binding protein